MFDLLKSFALFMIVFVPLEVAFPRDKKKRVLRRAWKTDLLHATLTAIFINFLSIMVLWIGYVIVNFFLPESVKSIIGSQHIALQLIEIAIIADIGAYFMHRLFHTVPALWKFHALHHSIEEMDCLAANRVHFVDQVLTRATTFIIPVSIGFSPAALGAFFLFYGWHSRLKHSNVNVNFGVFKWLLVSPTYHHWHHSNEPEAHDKNFAAQLPILDVIFGTAIMSENQGPKIYGTDDDIPEGYVDQLVAPFRRTASKKASP